MHGDCGDITKDMDEVSTKSKKGVGEGIVCVNPNRKAKHLLDQRPQERVKVDRFLRTWDDSDAQDVLEMCAYVRREIVIEQDERLSHFCAMLGRRKTICGKPQCKVAVVLKVLMTELLAIDDNILS